MVSRIINAGFPVHLWARREASLAQYEAGAFTRAESIADLGRVSTIVGVCVFGADDVREVLAELLPAMSSGGVVLIHATVAVDVAREFAEMGESAGIAVLDAPVSGSRDGAIAGTLAVMVGGDPDAFAKAEQVMNTYGACVRLLGPTGSGQKAKVVNNMLVAANIRTAHEALQVAHDIGLDDSAVCEVLLASTSASTALRSLVTKLSVDPLRARHSLRMIEKDVAAYQNACASAGVKLGLLDDLAWQAAEVVRELGSRD